MLFFLIVNSQFVFSRLTLLRICHDACKLYACRSYSAAYVQVFWNGIQMRWGIQKNVMNFKVSHGKWDIIFKVPRMHRRDSRQLSPLNGDFLDHSYASHSHVWSPPPACALFFNYSLEDLIYGNVVLNSK